MKRGFLFLVSLLFFMGVHAQAKIEFEESVHDFGTFSEEEAFVNHSFKFKNTGNAPLVIIKAKATCGCTVPSYPKAPIAPGESGVIDVKYSAIGRPGAFNKSVKITTNGSPAETNLTIKGNVVTNPDNNNYKYYINGLKLKEVSYDMGNIVKGEKRVLEFDTWNGSDRNLTITLNNPANHIKVEALPAKLNPGERGKIKVTFDSKACNDWGRQIDEFLISAERPDSRTMNKKIAISSNVTEDFSKQGNKRPKAEIEKVLVNLGDISGISTTNYSVKLKNSGNGNLIIRKVSSSAQTIKASISQTEIKPNGVATLTISLNPTKSKSRIVNETITIITNDSQRSEIEVQVTASLK